ncbi:MAG: hypothetical protein ACM3ZC_11635 [Bacteroidota bacterium]
MKEKNSSIIMIVIQFIITLPLYLTFEVINLKGPELENFSTYYLLSIVVIGLIVGLFGGYKTNKWWLAVIVSLSSGFLIVILGMILAILFSYRPENRGAVFFAFLVAMIQTIYIFGVIVSSLVILVVNKRRQLTHK